MNLLFLASRDWMDPGACGGDLCTTDYARELAARGHRVTLLVSRYPGSPREETVLGVRILRPGRLFFLALWAFMYYLRRRQEFDAVYQEGLASLRLPFLAPLYVRKPLVTMWYQLHGAIFVEQYGQLRGRILAFAERMLLALHKRHIMLALSEDRRQELIAHGFPHDRVRVVPPPMLDSCHGVAPEAERKPLVVWLGKIRRYKCPHHAVEAMAEVVREVPEARLVIAGRRDDEKYETELRSLANRLGVANHVELRPNIPDDEKWALLASARALVITSPVEGFGIVSVEANQCGTPTVATEGTPIDVVQDGHNGLRVSFGDRRGLASALVRLLTDRMLFDSMSRNAREHAAQFTPDEVSRRLEESFAAATARAA